MSALLAFGLLVAGVLAPGRDHAALVGAIVRKAEAEAPLFKADNDRTKTTAFAIAVAFRESSLRADALGDFRNGKPTSFCAFQIHVSIGGSEELARDVDACVGKAFEILRQSFRICPAHPLAFYAEGPRGCESPRAQRISRDRLALAAWAARTVIP